MQMLSSACRLRPNGTLLGKAEGPTPRFRNMEEEGAESGKECCDVLASGHEHKAAMATHDNRLQKHPTFQQAALTGLCY